MFNKDTVEVKGSHSPMGDISSLPRNIAGKRIQLGLCCLNTTLRAQKPSIYTSRTLRLKTLEEKGVGLLKSRVLENIDDLERMIHWNVQNNIHVFRLSSEMFPHMSNPDVPFYGFDFCKDRLQQIGELAKKVGHRLTFHPGQFNVLGTKDSFTLEKTLVELDLHANVLDLLGGDENSVFVIHGGGVYGDKDSAKRRWVENFGELSDSAARRLVLENCERSYSVRDCLEISYMVYERYGMCVPIVIDSHHYDCYTKLHPDETQEPIRDLLVEVLQTWVSRGIRPKFHVSEQGSGRIGHHSNLIECIPEYMLEIPKRFNLGLDIMIEAKWKEQAIIGLYDKYPEIFSA